MTTPTHRRPHRGRMAVAAVTAVVLVVAGLVLLATAGPSQQGDPAQAIAGAPNPTTSLPNTPGPPSSLAGAATTGGPVSTPGHPSPGAVADGSVSTPGSDAGAPAVPAVPVPSSGPGAPPAASGAGPGQPGSSSGTDAGGPASGPAGADVPGQPGSVAISDSARRAALAGVPSGLPLDSLAIPSLGVNAPLGPICGEPGGVLEPPVNSVGMLCDWRGSAPADATAGMTTIAGHINYGARVGAFARLAQLRPGQVIFTRGMAGPHAWIIRSEFARPKTLPLDVGAFAGPDGPRALVLISCGGNLIPGERSYADNIYVFATPA